VYRGLKEELSLGKRVWGGMSTAATLALCWGVLQQVSIVGMRLGVSGISTSYETSLYYRAD